MTTPIAVTVPEQLITAIESDVSQAQLPRWALEALVIEAVREDLISRGFGGEILGLGFHEREELYARRGVVYSYTAEELAAEHRDLESLLGSK